jgi:predicted transcriptional regulator
MKNRSRMDIVGLTLQAAIKGATKAKIMDLVHISIFQAKDYLFVLMENGLLCYGKGTGIYKTTEKGLRMLRNYNLISEQMVYNVELTQGPERC